MKDKYEDKELAHAVRTIYKRRLAQNTSNVEFTHNVQKDAMSCYMARVDAKNYARSIWKVLDIERYVYLQQNYPVQTFEYYVEKYEGDYQKIIDNSVKTNKRFDDFAGVK